MGKLFRFFLLILLLPFIAVFTYEAFLFVLSIISLEATLWFLLGLGLFLLFYVVLLHNQINFLEHLQHEATHAAISFILSGQLPGRMVVDPEKGSEVGPVRGGCVTTLAPYYFPLLATPLLLLKALVALALYFLEIPFPPVLEGALDFLIGFTLGFHLVCVFRQFSPRQSDFKKVGCIFSIVSVLFLNLIFFVLTLTVVTQEYAALLAYVKGSLVHSVDTYKATLEFLRTRLPPAIDKVLKWIGNLFCRNCASAPAGGS